MAQIIDQIVKVSIEDAISSVSTVNVNTVALLGASTIENAVAKSVVSADSAKTYFGEGSQLHEMAKDFFNQPTQPSKVVCIPLKKAGSAWAASDILTAIKGAAGAGDFYHICMVGDDFTSEAIATLDEDLDDLKKILHVQMQDAEAPIAGDRIATYKHKESWTQNSSSWKEYLNVAVVAYRCGKDSARGSFAHKKVKGITADTYSVQDFSDLKDAGVNVYTTVSSEARLFMGTTRDASHFIDQVVKDDWARFNVQSAIYQLLGEANDGFGVNLDDAGIASIASTVLSVLNVGEDSQHQYFMQGSSEVDYKSYDYLKTNYADEIKKRNVPLISGKYARMNAVHTVQEVKLQVTL